MDVNVLFKQLYRMYTPLTVQATMSPTAATWPGPPAAGHAVTHLPRVDRAQERTAAVEMTD